MRKLRWLLAGFGVTLIVAVPSLASADVNDFTITSFKSDQTLTQQDRQGELRIVERINVIFTDQNHGLLRALPMKYKNHSLQLQVNRISSETGAPTEYTTYDSNGNKVFKIGDPDKTVTGMQQYTIDYTVRNVVTFYNDNDELYWNVNGDQWPQIFASVEATVHLPKDVNQTKTPVCYTGSRGSTQQNCVATSSDNTVRVSTTQPLQGYEGLTYALAFQKGAFQPSTWYETVSEYTHAIVGVVGPMLIIGGSGFLLWYRRGRDAKGRGTIVPQYDSPNQLKPIQVDGLTDFTVGNTGITATIIDLAIRGHIKIIESKNVKTLRKDTTSYTLELLKADHTKLDSSEQKLITALFGSNNSGNKVDISKQKNKLHSTATSLRSSVKQQLIDDGYFQPSAWRGVWARGKGIMLISIVLLAFVIIYGGVASIAGVAIGITIAVICLLALDARTEKGVAAKEHVEGLKLYLNVAEKDRIKLLQSPNAKYAEGSKEPKRTVNLFEKLLPYAIVLGVEKEWSKQFEALYTTPPDWYSGSQWRTFNAVYLTSYINDGIGSAVNTAFSAPSSSGSSGSGGGGFSGGGGGGGGGGGW